MFSTGFSPFLKSSWIAMTGIKSKLNELNGIEVYSLIIPKGSVSKAKSIKVIHHSGLILMLLLSLVILENSAKPRKLINTVKAHADSTDPR